MSVLNARCALYDDEMKPLWNSCGEFFDNFDLSIVTQRFPIKKETHIIVDDGGTQSVLSVVPVYRSKRLVTGYALVLRDSYDVLGLVNHTSLSEFMVQLLREGQESLGHIISVNKTIASVLSSSKAHSAEVQLLDCQYEDALALYNSMCHTMAYTELKTDGPVTINSNISALLGTICAETSQILSKTKRKLIKKIDTKNYYAKIRYQNFIIAFMSLMRSQLIMSPEGGDISVSSRCTGNVYSITLKTDIDQSLSDDVALKSRYERELARKIIVSDCGGEITFTVDEQSVVTLIKLPIIRKNRGTTLNLENAEYLTGEYQPIRTFLYDIIQKESGGAYSSKKVASKPASSEKKERSSKSTAKKSDAKKPAAKKAPAKRGRAAANKKAK